MSQKITYVDKITVIPLGISNNNKWSGSNAQEVKDVINAHSDDISALQGSVGVLLTKKLKLTQSQIKVLSSSPVEIIASPGAGKYIQAIGISAYLNHNGTSYINPTTLFFKVGNQQWIIYGIVNQTSSFVQVGSSIDYSETIINSSAEIFSNSDDINDGGTIDVDVQYVIIDTN